MRSDSKIAAISACCLKLQVTPLEVDKLAKQAARDAVQEFSREQAARAPSKNRPCPPFYLAHRHDVARDFLEAL